ncbi:MAG: 2-methylcitrate dehydratase [Syntrophorhabdus sp. PtaU1.Bin058]|nr:MAG: 2-methylcitrate dehydratase [Syntrophorhabdus sp. PtaU1.Bin058]
MQSNIDGSLAVRVIQGSASQSGIIAAQLAKRGITGPENFLEGTYGYFHFYAKDKTALHRVTSELGKRFEMDRTLFKRYPSCGGTLAPTDAVLDLIRETDIVPEEIKSIDILVSPHVYKLVGGPFKVGKNPKVDAQFNIRYCVANALLRKGSRLRHFDASCVKDPRITDLVNLIHVSPEASYENPEKAAFSIGCQVDITMKNGSVYSSSSGVPRGGAGSPLTAEEHAERFQDCINYSEGLLPQEQVEEIVSLVGRLEQVDDATRLIPLLMPKQVYGATGSRG